MGFLNKIRHPKKGGSMPKKLAFSFLALLFGFGLGVLSKFLDTVPINEMPGFLAAVDIANFFGLVLPWAFIALVLAVFSKTPLRAAVNVFCFFAGMLIGYYLYCGVFAGFLPDWSYLSVWLILTAVSPLLAAICWYARGKGAAAVIISSFIIAYFFLQAFTFTPDFYGFGLNWRYGILPLLLLLAAVGVLLRYPLQSLIAVAAGFGIAYIYILLPFSVPLI